MSARLRPWCFHFPSKQSANMALPCTVAPDLFVGRDARRGHLVSLPAEALRVHMHVIGASGSGKSNYLTAIAMQLLLARQGATIIDPHPGSVIDTILAWVAEHRLDRSRSIRLIDPADPEVAFSFNPLAPRGFDPSVLVDLVVSATLQAWGQGTVTETPQITEVLTELYTALCVLELPLTDASDFLYRKDEAKARVRQWHLKRLEELAPDTWAFWHDLELLRPDRQDEYLAPVRRRLSPFTRSPYIRRIFSQTNQCLDVAAEMDAGAMTLINLRPSPYLSGEVSRLLGALLTNEFYVAGFRRKNMSLQHYLIIDEFQRFLSPNVARALEESRKTGLSWVLAHQHLGHLRAEGEHLFRSVMTNTRTKVVFGGLEVEDSEYMAQTLWRGSFRLQRAMPQHYRVAAVGNERMVLRQTSQTAGVNSSTGSTWAQGTAIATSRATTRGTATSREHSTTKSESQSDSSSSSFSRAASVTESSSHTDGETTDWRGDDDEYEAGSESSSDTYGGSSTLSMSSSHSSSFSSSRGTADTHGEGSSRSRSRTSGRTMTKSSQHGGTTSRGESHATTHGESEAMVTKYGRVAGPLYSLSDQVHMKSVSLANLPVGSAYVKIGSAPPRRVIIPYVGGIRVLPELIDRLRRQLLAATPYVAPAAEVDAAYAAHRARLEAAANPAPAEQPSLPEPDDVQWK